MYRNNPVKWQKPLNENKQISKNDKSSSTQSPKKDARKAKPKKAE